MGDFPVCMAKTQYSLSDDAKKLGRPSGFKINVREVYASAGAGFVVAVNGSIIDYAGLSKKPAAYGIDVDDNGASQDYSRREYDQSNRRKIDFNTD